MKNRSFVLCGFLLVWFLSKPGASSAQHPNRLIAVHRGPDLALGRIDDRGNFIQDPAYGPFKFPRMPEVVPFGFDSGRDVLTLPRCYFPGFRKWPERVYEFRSDCLIPGVLDERGRFVPDAGGIIIGLQVYPALSFNPPRIYNLPPTVTLKKDEKKQDDPRGDQPAPGPNPAKGPDG